MRDVYHAQLPLAARSHHPRAAELSEMSRVLDANRAALRSVHEDLLRVRSKVARD
jgi:hypothetical protein